MAGGGGAWKVAYADFVTAMMAFFMVMWLVGQKDGAKQAVAEYFQDPWATSRINANKTRDPSVIEKRAGNDNNKKKQGGNPKVVPHEDPEAPDYKKTKIITVREPERTADGVVIPFEAGSTQIPPDGKKRLESLLPILVGNQHKIDVRGHTAKQFASADVASNEEYDLSYRRCLDVRKTLIELGISPERIRLSQAASNEPLTLVTGGQDNEGNARVEVFMTTDTVEDYQGTKKERDAMKTPRERS